MIHIAFNYQEERVYYNFSSEVVGQISEDLEKISSNLEQCGLLSVTDLRILLSEALKKVFPGEEINLKVTYLDQPNTLDLFLFSKRVPTRFERMLS